LPEAANGASIDYARRHPPYRRAGPERGSAAWVAFNLPARSDSSSGSACSERAGSATRGGHFVDRRQVRSKRLGDHDPAWPRQAGSGVEGNPPILRRSFPKHGALGLDPPGRTSTGSVNGTRPALCPCRASASFPVRPGATGSGSPNAVTVQWYRPGPGAPVSLIAHLARTQDRPSAQHWG